jgi:hypothetical protein
VVLKKGVEARIEWLDSKSIECKKKETSAWSAGNQEKNGKQNVIRAVVDYQSENLAINDCMCFSK